MELLGTSNNGLRHFGVIDFAKKKLLCDSHSQLKSNIIICRGCDLLLGYHSFVREREKHFLTMNALLNYKIYECDDSFSSGGSTAEFVLLSCTGCSSQIGIKFGSSFYIFADMVRERKRKITAAIIALKAELTTECETLIGSVNQLEQLEIEITIHHFILQKAQLQKFKLQFSYDICIIVHKEEGRLLLFDTNGLYDTVFRECFSNSQGNVLLVLILSPEHGLLQSESAVSIQSSNQDVGSSSSSSSTIPGDSQVKQIAKSSVCDKQYLAEIAVKGKQPLLALLSKNQLVMTIFEQQINKFQIEFLASFLHNSQSKPLLPADLKNHLKFVKRVSSVDVTDSQEALLSHFIDQVDENPRLTSFVDSLKNAFIFSKRHKDTHHSSEESDDNYSDSGEDQHAKQDFKQNAKDNRNPEKPPSKMKSQAQNKTPRIVQEDPKCPVF